MKAKKKVKQIRILNFEIDSFWLVTERNIWKSNLFILFCARHFWKLLVTRLCFKRIFSEYNKKRQFKLYLLALNFPHRCQTTNVGCKVSWTLMITINCLIKKICYQIAVENFSKKNMFTRAGKTLYVEKTGVSEDLNFLHGHNYSFLDGLVQITRLVSAKWNAADNFEKTYWGGSSGGWIKKSWI